MPQRELKSLRHNGNNNEKTIVHHEHRSKRGRRGPVKAYAHLQLWRKGKEKLKIKDLEEI